MNSKKPIQSRTLWFNILSVLAIALTEILASPELREMLGGYTGILMVAGAVVNAMLRLDTSKAIKMKPKPKPKLNPVDQAIEDEEWFYK